LKTELPLSATAAAVAFVYRKPSEKYMRIG